MLVFDLQDYTFAELDAHVSLKETYKRDGQAVFIKVYQADGATQASWQWATSCAIWIADLNESPQLDVAQGATSGASEEE